MPTPHPLPDKSGQNRTSPCGGGSSLGNYAAKKSIDLLAKYAEHTLIPPKPNANMAAKAPTSPRPPTVRPLVALTAQDIIEDTFNESLRAPVDLPPDWQDFLGDISYPFKMLVWGLPGSGKSSFCMQLANQIGRQHWLLYIAGEEELTNQTMVDKQRRLITQAQAQKNCVFLDRLPLNASEWKQVLASSRGGQSLFCRAIFYDSVTYLGISPFYVPAAAHEFNQPLLPGLAHIFITHAHKDGQAYRGDGSWGHEVDVVIRVEKGLAITEKNRFGEVGRSLRVF